MYDNKVDLTSEYAGIFLTSRRYGAHGGEATPATTATRM